MSRGVTSCIMFTVTCVVFSYLWVVVKSRIDFYEPEYRRRYSFRNEELQGEKVPGSWFLRNAKAQPLTFSCRRCILRFSTSAFTQYCTTVVNDGGWLGCGVMGYIMIKKTYKKLENVRL
jgi:hypothetical protein